MPAVTCPLFLAKVRTSYCRLKSALSAPLTQDGFLQVHQVFPPVALIVSRMQPYFCGWFPARSSTVFHARDFRSGLPFPQAYLSGGCAPYRGHFQTVTTFFLPPAMTALPPEHG